MARYSTTPFAVLAMLSLGPKSGYDITRELAFSVGHFWAESNGQLYPALRMLVAAGLATVLPRGRDVRRRTIYAITPSGRAAITEWLARPAALPAVRNELLLKLFVGWHAGLDVSASHVERMRSAIAAQSEQFAAIRKILDEECGREPDAEFWRITVRTGQAVAAARLAWCEETLGVFRRLARRQPTGSVPSRSRRMNALMRRLQERLEPAFAKRHRKRAGTVSRRMRQAFV